MFSIHQNIGNHELPYSLLYVFVQYWVNLSYVFCLWTCDIVVVVFFITTFTKFLIGSENNKPYKSGESIYVPPSEELCGKELNHNSNADVQSYVIHQIPRHGCMHICYCQPTL